MKHFFARLFLPPAVCLLAWSAPLIYSAEVLAPPATPVPAPPAPLVIPPDINGYRTVIAPPAKTKPVKAAIYQDKGGPKSSVDTVVNGIRSIPGATVTILNAEEVGTTDLKAFDVVLFCGGAGATQSKAIGEAGRSNVKEFIRGGGGYVGICAGAYLACDFSWGLGVINARTVSTQWRRGSGFVDLEVTDPGRRLLGDAPGPFKIRYNNGPIIKPANLPDVPAYTPVSLFRSEVAENGTPVGVMVNSPAQAIGTFGQGRVFISSPHAENTPGLEHLIPRAVLWASGVDAL
jgi:hypothetical protein